MRFLLPTAFSISQDFNISASLKSRVLHLIDILAVDSIASVSCGAFSTFPRAIWEACTLSSIKAWTWKASICETWKYMIYLGNTDYDHLKVWVTLELTNWTGLFVANLAGLCISHTVFAAIHGYWIIAKTFMILDSTATGGRASIPGWPWSPATTD